MSKMKKGKEKAGGFLKEFKEFALKGNMIDMAVGIIIGGAFSGLVTSLIDNIITPLINSLGSVDAEKSGLVVKVNGQTLNFGALIGDILNFIIMAFVVFLIVKAINNLSKVGKKKEVKKEDPTTKKCPYCFSEIDIKATKCPCCTSDIPVEKIKKNK